jgi:glycerol kinase
VQWLRDGLGALENSAQSETLAMSVSDNGDVYFVPGLTGLGAPYWDQYARGLIIGITRGTTAAHITRAALEAICFQVYDVMVAMASDIGTELVELKVDGGAVANNFLMQFQSDVLGVKVIRSQIQESTALGVAYLAGLAIGYWKDIDEIKKHQLIDQVFEPQMEPGEAVRLISNWNRAVERAKNWIVAEEELLPERNLA